MKIAEDLERLNKEAVEEHQRIEKEKEELRKKLEEENEVKLQEWLKKLRARSNAKEVVVPHFHLLLLNKTLLSTGGTGVDGETTSPLDRSTTTAQDYMLLEIPVAEDEAITPTTSPRGRYNLKKVAFNSAASSDGNPTIGSESDGPSDN